jgi:Mor family transcriptional regulator
VENLLPHEIIQYHETFMALLLRETSGTSMLPELFEVFDPEEESGTLARFLDVFAGVTFDVPSRDNIQRHIRDAAIYHLVTRGVSTEEIAQSRGMTRLEVRRIARQVGRVMKELKGASAS